MKRALIAGISLAVGSFALAFFCFSNVNAEEEAVKKSPLNWATDHYAIDVMTTATASRWINPDIEKNKPLLSNDELKKRIGKQLAEKQLYILGTSYNDRPASTVVEFILSPEDMALYGFAEPLTEAVLHMRKNPYISANFHHEFPNDWNEGLCLQMRGKAELFEGPFKEGQTPKAVKRAIELFSGELGSWLEKKSKGAIGKAAGSNMTIVRIPLAQIVMHDARLSYEGYGMRELWLRNP